MLNGRKNKGIFNMDNTKRLYHPNGIVKSEENLQEVYSAAMEVEDIYFNLISKGYDMHDLSSWLIATIINAEDTVYLDTLFADEEYEE